MQQTKHQMRNIYKYILFFGILALLGFSRKYLFVNINNQLYKLYYHNDSIQIPANLNFLTNYSYSTLYYGKYFLTILFFALYFVVSFLAVKFICTNKKITRWIVYIYALLLSLSIIAMGYNYLINNQLDGEEYTFSRWLMGIAQSPLVAFFTIATSKLYNSFNTNKI